MGDKRKEAPLRKTVAFALSFAIAVFWIHPIFFVARGDFHQIFCDVIFTVYSVASVLALYPILRIKAGNAPYFSLLALGFSAIIGIPIFLLVMFNCETFNFGTQLAYLIYGYILLIAILAICVSDTLITLAVKLMKKAKRGASDSSRDI